LDKGGGGGGEPKIGGVKKTVDKKSRCQHGKTGVEAGESERLLGGRKTKRKKGDAEQKEFTQAKGKSDRTEKSPSAGKNTQKPGPAESCWPLQNLQAFSKERSPPRG